MSDWPPVDVNEYGQITCPVGRCDAELYLVRTYSIPLHAEEPGPHGPTEAVTDSWQVECVNGHALHNSVDQARETNARGGEEDESGGSAPEFDLRILHERINALGGERL